MYPAAGSGKESGFTLVEFVVASLILTVGVLGLLKTVDLSLSVNAGNKMRSNAIVVADQAMSEERTKPFNSISSSTASKPGLLGARFVNYSITKNVIKMGTVSKNVQFIISWRDKGAKNTHSLSTVLSNYSSSSS